MSFEEEVELRDMVTQTLEVNGCLSKIKAQLRASLFLALDEDPKVSSEKPMLNTKIKSQLESADGPLMFCIVREFLEFFDLDFTISVYEPESYLDSHYKYEGRSKILDDLGINNVDNNTPILYHLVKIAQAKSKKTLEINLNLNEETVRESQERTNNNSEITSNGIVTTNGIDHHHDQDPDDIEIDIENEPNSLNSTYVKQSPDDDLPKLNERKNDKKSIDILPSLYNKEFKEKANLKDLDKLFDMEADYEEDFMSPSEIELSSFNQCENSKSLMEELETTSESKIITKIDDSDATDNIETSLSVDSSNANAPNV